MKEDHGLDRVAMIEAASRSLRQQMRGAFRPNSKGMHEGEEPRSAENAQRRIRSAEKHRSASSHEPEPRSTAPPSTTVELEEDVEEVMQDGNSVDDMPRVPVFPQELKRPASRKKDPSASAAAGLGISSGAVRMTDAFEQKKTRQPIPVESWGPRPPSRAGLPSKDEARAPSQGSRPSSKSLDARKEQLGSKVVGGTWAAARDSADGRKGRRTNKGPEAADLGIFGRGQQLTKSLSSGLLDTQYTAPKAPRPVLAEPQALEVSGCGLGDAWPASPQSCGGTPPVRRRPESQAEGHATPPQVIVTRSQPSRGQLRRSVDQRVPRERERMPFPTSLDVDFLSLFAS